jgi:hypothetical protein
VLANEIARQSRVTLQRLDKVGAGSDLGQQFVKRPFAELMKLSGEET